ncbi:hypothetical protein [Psychromonas sp. SP041]|uniref:hypothetical protein n=1 Tax=Psychromonas sp. SP041 TaxID=1365007 RepID=UPI00040926F3|nr:hypothetical protein [Psychromonas sp. SP041]
MSDKADNVVSIVHDSTRVSEDFTGLKSSLGFLDWTLQVQTLIKASGLPVGDVLLEKEAIIPVGSMAFGLGHKNLADFITGSHENLGVSWSWDKWLAYATAFRHKSFYEIHLNDPEEINAQYNDIKLILGRDPINSAEFHVAKEQNFNNQKSELIKSHESVKLELNNKLSAIGVEKSILQNELNKVGLELKAGNADNQALKEEQFGLLKKVDSLEQEKKNLFIHYSDMEARFKKEVEDIKVATMEAAESEHLVHTAELNLKHKMETESLQKGYIFTIEEEKAKAKIALGELISVKKTMIPNEKHDQIVSVITSENIELKKSIEEAVNTMVTYETHGVVVADLKAEKERTRELSFTAHDAETKLLEVSGMNEQSLTQVSTLQKIVESQSSLIESLKQVSIEDASSQDVFSLQCKIDKLDYYAKTFKAQALAWKEKYDAQIECIDLLNKQIELISGQLKSIKLKVNVSKLVYTLSGFAIGSLGLYVALLSIGF